jgi:hypothetical protein
MLHYTSSFEAVTGENTTANTTYKIDGKSFKKICLIILFSSFLPKALLLN